MTTNENAYFRLRKNSKEIKLNLAGYWSYPIYYRTSKGTYWMYYISAIESIFNSNKTLIYRPHALLVTLPNSDEVIQFQNFKKGFDSFPNVVWEKTIGQFPFDAIGNLTMKQFRKKEIELIDLCYKNIYLFNKIGVIDEEMQDLYKTLCNPLHIEFIRCQSPLFYKCIWG
ncbi:hypothetical protein DSCO28_02750 [Desulfosarcina ovata subsp. sediminis]|uniref:Uncharacterized protein n=1 Tax=Desulfosarcina ovata subsp. sediminis TaxID=885957 RepID=A0A5K7ZJ06_9BACT|nr:hypothetical protein [Desulfosarcina ovata]BBO79709.1 hypothetical protein DSCO28_02750 [Desulfosarcina ovata subsp. sediminis]